MQKSGRVSPALGHLPDVRAVEVRNRRTKFTIATIAPMIFGSIFMPIKRSDCASVRRNMRTLIHKVLLVSQFFVLGIVASVVVDAG